MNTAREICIQPVLNGYICKIGCQKVVFTSLESMTGEIEKYYENPEKVEAEYLKNAVNKTMPDVPISAPPTRRALIGIDIAKDCDTTVAIPESGD